MNLITPNEARDMEGMPRLSPTATRGIAALKHAVAMLRAKSNRNREFQDKGLELKAKFVALGFDPTARAAFPEFAEEIYGPLA
jgi:hypothetical protein